MTAGTETGVGVPDYDSATRHRKSLLGAVDTAAWAKRLGQFMAQQPGVAGHVLIDDLSIPSAGGSSGTILFTATYDAGGSRRCVLRHATEGGLFHSYDLPGQFSILQTLQGGDVVVPGVVGLDPDGATLGVPGYVMDWVDGETPPASYYSRGLLKQASPASRRLMVLDILGNLARLHAVSSDAPGLEFLRRRGEGATAIERDVDWNWESLRWGCPGQLAAMQPIRRWLLDYQPRETHLSLNHGDTMLANYMFRGDTLVAVLDWELAFLGNPAHDIAYQVQSHALLGLGAEPLEGMPTPEEWRAEYERLSGGPLADWEYCSAVTAYKLHIALLLVYRETAPGMEVARDAVLAHTWTTLSNCLEAAKRQVT